MATIDECALKNIGLWWMLGLFCTAFMLKWNDCMVVLNRVTARHLPRGPLFWFLLFACMICFNFVIACWLYCFNVDVFVCFFCFYILGKKLLFFCLYYMPNQKGGGKRNQNRGPCGKCLAVTLFRTTIQSFHFNINAVQNKPSMRKVWDHKTS
jgi:hypothetical protein